MMLGNAVASLIDLSVGAGVVREVGPGHDVLGGRTAALAGDARPDSDELALTDESVGLSVREARFLRGRVGVVRDVLDGGGGVHRKNYTRSLAEVKGRVCSGWHQPPQRRQITVSANSLTQITPSQ
jgi:hypothetical protein